MPIDAPATPAARARLRREQVGFLQAYRSNQGQSDEEKRVKAINESIVWLIAIV
jgi:hypothetical protein